MPAHDDDKKILVRDCDAIQIPYGNTITARKDTAVQIVSQLGDTFTVRTEHGYLLRIAAADADALGVPKPAAQPVKQGGGPASEADCWEALRSCYDPEIPVNIVDLGLIYRCEPTPLPSGNQRVAVQMTLTAPGCGMGQVLRDDVEAKILSLPGVEAVDVELVFSPPWDPTMMTDAARLELGMM